METIHDIFVKVSYDIGDGGFDKVARSEYQSALATVAEKISREVPLLLHKYELTIAQDTRDIMIPVENNPYYYVRNDLGIPVPDVDGINLYPISIEKVVRYNQDCREFSFTAIESARRGAAPFKTNDTSLDFRAYCVRLMPNGQMQLSFVTELQAGDELEVYTTMRLPFEKTYFLENQATAYMTPKWASFRDRTPLPKLIIPAVYKSLRAEIIAMLVSREGGVWEERYGLLKQEAIEEVHELRRYVMNMKDKSSLGQIQPFKFLSAHSDEDFVTNPNIPEEWTGKIII